jgi:hypothetical protein
LSRNASRRTLASALLLALSGTPGCYVKRTTPVVPVPIHLASPGGFLIRHGPVDASVSTGQCRVVEARGELERLSGDTLVFRRVSYIRQPKGDTRCQLGAPNYVVISQHPELRAQSKQFSAGRTLLAVPLLMFGSFMVVGILAFALTP